MENKDLNQIIEELANEIIENIRANMRSYGVGDGNLAKSLEYENMALEIVVYMENSNK